MVVVFSVGRLGRRGCRPLGLGLGRGGRERRLGLGNDRRLEADLEPHLARLAIQRVPLRAARVRRVAAHGRRSHRPQVQRRAA